MIPSSTCRSPVLCVSGKKFLGVLHVTQLLDDTVDPRKTREAVAIIIAIKSVDEWVQRFGGVDACVLVVKSVKESVESPHFRERCLSRARIASVTGLPSGAR